MATVRYEVEHTDTFGGQANYCWVNRYEIELPSPDMDRAKSRRFLVRKAKELTGMTGVRCETSDMGDTIEIRPRGMAQVIFVTYIDD